MKIGKWKWVILVVLIAVGIYLGTGNFSVPGADKKVNALANQYAQEVGAGERPPYINTDKGDLLLFLFLAGGAIAGFWLGYAWRDLFGKKPTLPQQLQISKKEVSGEG